MSGDENHPLVENVKGAPASSRPTYESSLNEISQNKDEKPVLDKESKDSKESTENDKLSYLQGLMHYLKAYVTTGYLTLPFAVKQAGLWAGVGGLLVLSLITLCCVLLMVECIQSLCKRLKREKLTYAEAMEASFALGPRLLQRHAAKGKAMVQVFLFLLVFGCCVVYLSLLSAYSKQLLSLTDIPEIDIRAYVAAWAALLVPVCCIRNLRIFVPFSTVGNIANVVGLVIIFQYILRDIPDISSRSSFTSVTGILVFIGDALYAFEGVGMIIAIENRMKRPEDYGGISGVAGIGTIIVILLYIATAVLGFLKFGDKAEGSIILNLPTGEGLYMAVKILALLNLYVSIGVNIYLPTSVVWNGIEPRLKPDTKLQKWGEYIVRITILLLILICVLAVPDVALLVPLVGSLCGSMIAFICPSLMKLLLTLSPEYAAHYSRKRQTFVITIFAFLLIIAIVFSGIAICLSVLQVVYHYAYGRSIKV